MASLHEMDMARQEQEIYSHKKFKSSATSQRYTHKKFGTRSIRQTPSMEEQDIAVAMTHTIIEQTKTPTKPSNSQRQLFRPYALGDDTPRKRKIKEVHSSDEQPMLQQQPHHVPIIHSQIPVEPARLQNPPSYAPQFATTPYLSMNKQALSLMMQKQRAAFYMSNLLRYNMLQSGRSMASWPQGYMANMSVAPPMLRHGC